MSLRTASLVQQPQKNVRHRGRVAAPVSISDALFAGINFLKVITGDGFIQMIRPTRAVILVPAKTAILAIGKA